MTAPRRPGSGAETVEGGFLLSTVNDGEVDESLDLELRAFLFEAFPHRACFRRRRWVREPPERRWLLRRPTGELVAHLAVHVKVACAGFKNLRIGGVCEVAVHPEERGKGLVRILLAKAGAWQVERGLAFSLLFGDPRVYGSSGYEAVTNAVRLDRAGDENEALSETKPLVLRLGQGEWPREQVILPGLPF